MLHQYLLRFFLIVTLTLAVAPKSEALTIVSYPIPDLPVVTRHNAPLCPSFASLQRFMQRAYAHDLNATLFDFGCFPAESGWPGRILAEQQGIDLWAKVRVILPNKTQRTFWTIAWEMQNSAPVKRSIHTIDKSHRRIRLIRK